MLPSWLNSQAGDGQLWAVFREGSWLGWLNSTFIEKMVRKNGNVGNITRKKWNTICFCLSHSIAGGWWHWWALVAELCGIAAETAAAHLGATITWKNKWWIVWCKGESYKNSLLLLSLLLICLGESSCGLSICLWGGEKAWVCVSRGCTVNKNEQAHV